MSQCQLCRTRPATMVARRRGTTHSVLVCTAACAKRLAHLLDEATSAAHHIGVSWAEAYQAQSGDATAAAASSGAPLQVGWRGHWIHHPALLSDVRQVEELARTLSQNSVDLTSFLREVDIIGELLAELQDTQRPVEVKRARFDLLLGALVAEDNAPTVLHATRKAVMSGVIEQQRRQNRTVSDAASWPNHYLLELMTRKCMDPSPDEYSDPTPYTPRFARTRRPLSYMRQFATRAVALTASSVEYWPVVRYQAAHGGGLYSTSLRSDEKPACYTFYFYEPDSHMYLPAERTRTLIAGNKVHAALLLYERAAPTMKTRIAGLLQELGKNLKSFLSELMLSASDGKRLVYTWERTGGAHIGLDDPFYAAVRHLGALLLQPTSTTQERLALLPWARVHQHTASAVLCKGTNTSGGVADYVLYADYHDSLGRYTGYAMMGRFDSLDTVICEAAHAQDYDVVVLQSEPGQGRAVTELLDTRVRATSFALLRQQLVRPAHEVADASQPALWSPLTDPPRVF